MTTAVFHRAGYSVVWLTLSSSETLGILDSDYLEDYFGVDGQVTIHHLLSGQRWPVLMVESQDEALPHEVFTGWFSLALLPDGDYQIEGQVRDVLGNPTVLSAVQNPLPGAQVEPLLFTIESGVSILPSLDLGWVRLTTDIELSPLSTTIMTMSVVTEETIDFPAPQRMLVMDHE